MKIPCCIFLHPFFAVDKHLGWRQTPWDDSTHEERRCLCIYICINVYMSYCFANIACLVMILLIYQHSHGTCPIYGWFSH
jgi:hypothetical protein